jgi:hypothetical protein
MEYRRSQPTKAAKEIKEQILHAELVKPGSMDLTPFY